MCYAPTCKPLNRIQSNFMCYQLPVMCTAHGERTIITVRYQTEHVEHKLDEKTDSHSGYSAHLQVVRKSLNIQLLLIKMYCDLHLFSI